VSTRPKRKPNRRSHLTREMQPLEQASVMNDDNGTEQQDDEE
jgi:hypothetical protein